jgi:hypothetical protein
VITLDVKVAHQANDIIQKYTSGRFKETLLKFFGITSVGVKGLINVELPVVEATQTSTDFIFLLEDDTLLHIEFQTTYTENDLIRFALYDWRLYGLHKKKIKTVVIYSSDVKKVDGSIDNGMMEYAPAKIMLYEYDGNAIYADLKAKLAGKQDLTDDNMLNLIFLPLMRNSVPKPELAKTTIELAQTIADKDKSIDCTAIAYAFALKYLNEEEANKLWEVIRMGSLAVKFFEDTRKEAWKEAELEKTLEIAKKMLADNEPIEKVVKFCELDTTTVKKLQKQLKQEK